MTKILFVLHSTYTGDTPCQATQSAFQSETESAAQMLFYLLLSRTIGFLVSHTIGCSNAILLIV